MITVLEFEQRSVCTDTFGPQTVGCNDTAAFCFREEDDAISFTVVDIVTYRSTTEQTFF